MHLLGALKGKAVEGDARPASLNGAGGGRSGEDSRNLEPEYTIAELDNGIPAALENLCDIAELDIHELIAAHKADDTALVSTIERRANKSLERRFTTEWRQSGVHVTLRVRDESIVIQVVNEQEEFTSLAERSDGLRQFVALLAFAGGSWKEGTILLIDEAEQRLHYDAQADLVQMLARQQFASKVIYTTHSAGCLPEDLGNGVRFARPSARDETRSEVRNEFWAESDPGFTPLLYGMGAGTLAFFPTRNAVMVEGPSDMLLLPSIMRAALQKDILGFQFVPGLSYADGPLHAPAIGKATGVLYLVDGDGGGESIRKRLIEKGIPKENVFSLGTSTTGGLEFEDFLHTELLLHAANSLLDKYFPNGARLTKVDFKTSRKMDALEKRYISITGQEIPKVPFAYEVLDALTDDPSRPLLDPKRGATMTAIAERIEGRFRALSDRRGRPGTLS
ncbi:ATP-dependent nuclease [Phenylobacterium sp. VNQ135]|uniref:ATP-dependent nuclease n=1 Tax=Phenylobacterium sp. VNQ135 TaxID=3400922 RepID=UPI003BFBECDF